MSQSAGLLNFTSQEPREILWEMFRIRQRILLGENIEMPLVTVMLWPEGRQVSGFVLDLKTEKQDHHIAIQIAGQQSSGDVTYFYLSAIRGITVYDIEKYEHILTELTSETRMNKTPNITKLEIRKRLDQEAKNLSEKMEGAITFEFKGDLPDGAMPLYVIANLITDVGMCMKELGVNDLGRQAMKEGVAKVVFTKTDGDFGVSKKESEIHISGKFNKSFSTTRGRWELRSKLESLL